jgi:hypothetical protein
MKFKAILGGILALALVGGMLSVPTAASAQTSSSSHRQKTKNDWRNAAYLGAGLATWGLLKNDSTLVFAGTVGALYSATRYEHDRKSQSRTDRARAAMFAKRSFVRDGHTYKRYYKTKNGKKYYYFKRVSGREWAATRGKKKGWDKNGKRG